MTTQTRRSFLKGALAVAGAATTGLPSMLGAETQSLHLATNVYPWGTFYGREGLDHNALLDTMLEQIAAAGLDGFEGIADGPADIDRIAPLLKKHGLQMRSLYVNSTLHDPTQVERSISGILRIAERARKEGARIIVTNPNPIQWGGPENKNDRQLRFQAQALNRLGTALKKEDVTLAYHFHDIELRMAARELHHMMVGTDPANVSLCLDTHWIFRGSGDSEVAVFDIATLYADRISELHLRQSKDGVWTETLGEGDIDYPRLATLLERHGVRPLLVLEQAVESGSPNTLKADAAHRIGAQYARRVFANVGTV